MSAAERKLAQIFHRQSTSFRNLNNSVAVGVEWNVSSFVGMFLSQKRLWSYDEVYNECLPWGKELTSFPFSIGMHVEDFIKKKKK